MSRIAIVAAPARGWRFPLAGLAFTLLAGCFSGSGSSSDSDGDLKGVFVDSPVAGLTYIVDGESRRTNREGQFSYRSGERLTFRVGGLELGSAEGAEVITPVDLVEDGSLQDPAVLNIARLLQTLDSDGNLVNGIQITEAIDQAVEDYLEANNLAGIDLADTPAFEAVMVDMLAELNRQQLFA